MSFESCIEPMHKTSVEMFCIFHKHYNKRGDNASFTFFGVNETYPKKFNTSDKVILEYELDKYNPFLQKRGYMETSAYLHVYWNKLYLGKDMIGFSQYDMKHFQSYDNLNNSCIYLFNAGRPIVNGGQWNNMMCSHVRNLDFLISSYNAFFGKTYSMTSLENIPLSLWQTNVYPVSIYEKLCRWLEVLVEDIYPWSNLPPYETHFGSIGGYTERAISIFNAFEIYEGCKYQNLAIQHGVGACEKEQYNTASFLNFYSQDVHTRLIGDITGKYGEEVNYSMFKSQCYIGDDCYSCERVCKNGKNGLSMTFDSTITGYGFDIEAEDPRLVVFNERVYVIFICLSPYPRQNRCIAITPFDDWNPVFLQIENMPKNKIEKNWAPFVKNGELYFVYNYDPLVILQYNFNPEGICRVVVGASFMPINTSTTFLRGGSNLIPYTLSHEVTNRYFIGGCHSRIYKNCFEHYTHIILLDTDTWKLVYVSKPVMYYCDTLKDVLFNSWWSTYSYGRKPLDTFHNLLTDKTPNIIQDPISIYCKENRYYITINVRDSVSLLYEISFSNLFDFVNSVDMPTGYYNDYVKKCIQ